MDSVQYERECASCGNTMLKESLNLSSRGHNLKLQVQHQPGVRKNLLAGGVVQPWNNLRQDTVDANNVNTFKTSLGNE